LQQRGVVLSPSEDAVLLAAWRAGRVGPALRACAEQRRQRAEFRRRMLGGLAYPVALLGMVVVASLATAPIVGHYWFAIGVVAALLVAGAVGFVVWRGLRRGDERWTHLPVIGRIVTDLAEIPYLETLQAMYGAGVPLVQAHGTAVATVPNDAVRQRLAIAGRVLGEGRNLTEALAASVSLHPDTRRLLATGEQSGQLEDALLRALTHRREMSARAVSSTLRRGTTIVYAIAVVLAVTVIFTFWFRLYGGTPIWRR
jgi:general secretion pathway protein F